MASLIINILECECMKLIVLDADGVLSKGEAHSFDLGLLNRLAELNNRARQGKPVPAVTLNTGRPSAYVEAVMQAIGGRYPALYESGAGLYFPATYQFETSPHLTPEHDIALQEVIKRIDQALVQSGRAYWQPGKTVCYSLFAHPPLTIANFTTEVKAIASQVSDQFMVTPAKLALNIHPAGINKGSGLQWLAHVTGIDPIDMAGVGDTTGDIDFLRLVGHAAAPANATNNVKAVVQYVSAQNDAAGLQDILDYWSIP
jgi:hydroxymethylpyrimidine pyrophosphatase-like HAD family hydrolase